MQAVIQDIILADDDDDDRSIFTDVIHNLNPSIKVQTVSDGAELMKMLYHFIPDMLFLDLEMPYKNGLECLVEIRNHKPLEQLPVIVFSSTTRLANIQTAYEMGANLFLIKEASFHAYCSQLKAILQLNWNEPEKIKQQHIVNEKFIAFT